MANYEFHEGSMASIKDIVKDAEQNKENIDGSILGSTILGEIVQDVWGEQVKRSYRGPRSQRLFYYLNLRRIPPSQSQNPCEGVDGDLLEQLSDMPLPDGWTMMSDRPKCVSFVRLETWEADNKRAATELVVSQMETSTLLTVKAHGCQIDLDNVVIESLTLKSRVCLAIEYIQKSALCHGFVLPDGECIDTQAHVIGLYNDLTSDSDTVRMVHSSQCKLFSVSGGHCSECNKVKKFHNRRMLRKEKQTIIHPFCNKRYLSRDELACQIQQERKSKINAEMRERYWREKFAEESVLVEDDDHMDLSTMIESVDKEKVPDEMLCLLDQQKKILRTKDKRGYRWHPK